ncbi:MAG: hypothetical protein ACI89X_003168 [Planctomycetota bacterium]|jgi:hypothetical protein
MKVWVWGCWLLLLTSCASTNDLSGLAAKPPLDRAVLVTGGAFFSPLVGSQGTFFLPDLDAPAQAPDPDEEAIPFSAILDVLNRGRVFQRVVGDTDVTRRRQLRQQLRLRSDEAGLSEFLQQAREDGFDLLVLVEELRDGPIESQGTNNRWPVTFATWILLGVGALIPDRTFESRATLRVSLRELQSGREISFVEVESGPVDLALTERTDLLGLVASIIVPPFWVSDDREAVAASVRATTERRLLLSLASKLKGEVFRRRIDSLAAADIQLVASPEGTRVVVQSLESISVVRIEGPGYRDAEVSKLFATELINSRDLQHIHFHYSALLPKATNGGAFQIRVGTLRGGVASATFTAESVR